MDRRRSSESEKDTSSFKRLEIMPLVPPTPNMEQADPFDSLSANAQGADAAQVLPPKIKITHPGEYPRTKTLSSRDEMGTALFKTSTGKSEEVNQEPDNLKKQGSNNGSNLVNTSMGSIEVIPVKEKRILVAEDNPASFT